MKTRRDYLDQAVEQVADVVADQQADADPAHEDFYAWGGALDEMTRRLAHACKVLNGQIGRYGDNRILRDDDGMDPAVRLVRTQSILRDLTAQLDAANRLAREYHQEASHIAVQVNPDADRAT